MTLAELNRKPPERESRPQEGFQWSLLLHFVSLRSGLSFVHTKHRVTSLRVITEFPHDGPKQTERPAAARQSHHLACANTAQGRNINASLLKWKERKKKASLIFNNFIPQTSKMKLPS